MGKTKIGFIGLGLMGSKFTERLINQGYAVYGYDRVTEKVAAAEKLDVVACECVAKVAQNTDQIHVCVMTSTDLEELVFGKDGLSSVEGAHKAIVDHSTTPADMTRNFAVRLKDKNGMDWIDAPVSGGPPAARDGTLAIMAGGTQSSIERVMPVLKNLGDCTHMGDIGAGQVTKMVNQVLVLNNYCILAESLALAEAGGVDPEKIPTALAQGHAGSNLLQSLFPRMIQRDYTPAGYASQILKDLHMVSDLAKKLDVPTPMSRQSTSLFQQLNDMGCADLDGSSVFKLFESSSSERVRLGDSRSGG